MTLLSSLDLDYFSYQTIEKAKDSNKDLRNRLRLKNLVDMDDREMTVMDYTEIKLLKDMYKKDETTNS